MENHGDNLVYDIQKAKNEVKAYGDAISRIEGEVPQFKIDRGDNEISPKYESREPERVSKSSLNYNSDAMAAVFGEDARELKNFSDVTKKFGDNAALASKKMNMLDNSFDSTKINTYEAQIKRLKSELSGLAETGFKQGDTKYDEVARELAKVVNEKKKYDKAMKQSVETDTGLKKTEVSLKEVRNHLKSVGKELANFGKKTVKAMGNAIKGVTKLKRAITGTQQQASKGMSLGRMIGSSVAFSFSYFCKELV